MNLISITLVWLPLLKKNKFSKRFGKFPHPSSPSTVWYCHQYQLRGFPSTTIDTISNNITMLSDNPPPWLLRTSSLCIKHWCLCFVHNYRNNLSSPPSSQISLLLITITRFASSYSRSYMITLITSITACSKKLLNEPNTRVLIPAKFKYQTCNATFLITYHVSVISASEWKCCNLYNNCSLGVNKATFTDFHNDPSLLHPNMLISLLAS